MMKYLIILFYFSPLLSCGQSFPPPADTVYLLFDQQSKDSLCSISYMDIDVPKEKLIRKYRKEVERDGEGLIKSITFRICSEKFVYNAKRNTVDTIYSSFMDAIAFTTLESAELKINQIEEKLNANADDTKVLYIYPKYALLSTVIVEKTSNNKLVAYQTGWVEKIE